MEKLSYKFFAISLFSILLTVSKDGNGAAGGGGKSHMGTKDHSTADRSDGVKDFSELSSFIPERILSKLEGGYGRDVRSRKGNLIKNPIGRLEKAYKKVPQIKKKEIGVLLGEYFDEDNSLEKYNERDIAFHLLKTLAIVPRKDLPRFLSIWSKNKPNLDVYYPMLYNTYKSHPKSGIKLFQLLNKLWEKNIYFDGLFLQEVSRIRMLDFIDSLDFAINVENIIRFPAPRRYASKADNVISFIKVIAKIPHKNRKKIRDLAFELYKGDDILRYIRFIELISLIPTEQQSDFTLLINRLEGRYDFISTGYIFSDLERMKKSRRVTAVRYALDLYQGDSLMRFAWHISKLGNFTPEEQEYIARKFVENRQEPELDQFRILQSLSTHKSLHPEDNIRTVVDFLVPYLRDFTLEQTSTLITMLEFFPREEMEAYIEKWVRVMAPLPLEPVDVRWIMVNRLAVLKRTDSIETLHRKAWRVMEQLESDFNEGRLSRSARQQEQQVRRIDQILATPLDAEIPPLPRRIGPDRDPELDLGNVRSQEAISRGRRRIVNAYDKIIKNKEVKSLLPEKGDEEIQFMDTIDHLNKIFGGFLVKRGPRKRHVISEENVFKIKKAKLALDILRGIRPGHLVSSSMAYRKSPLGSRVPTIGELLVLASKLYTKVNIIEFVKADLVERQKVWAQISDIFADRFPHIGGYRDIGVALDADTSLHNPFIYLLSGNLYRDSLDEDLTPAEGRFIGALKRRYMKYKLEQMMPLIEALFMIMRAHNTRIMDPEQPDRPACAEGAQLQILKAISESKIAGAEAEKMLAGVEIESCSAPLISPDGSFGEGGGPEPTGGAAGAS